MTKSRNESYHFGQSFWVDKEFGFQTVTFVDSVSGSAEKLEGKGSFGD